MREQNLIKLTKVLTEHKMIKELIKIANELDAKGLEKEADCLDEIVKKAMNPEAKYDLSCKLWEFDAEEALNSFLDADDPDSEGSSPREEDFCLKSVFLDENGNGSMTDYWHRQYDVERVEHSSGFAVYILSLIHI